MVFALAGDSTMTSALPIERYDPLFKKTAHPIVVPAREADFHRPSREGGHL